MPGFAWFFLPYLIPLSVIGGLHAGGWMTFQTVFWIYVVIPVLDVFIGSFKRNPDPAEETARENALGFKLVTWLWCPIQVSLIAWGIWVVSTQSLSTVEFIGFTVSMGMMAGTVGITFGHEMAHKAGKFERALAEILLASVTYTHFCVEHVYGHHRRVGTRPDPATARLGEHIYRFVPRSLFMGVVSAWRLEAARMRRRRRSTFSFANRMIRYGATLAAVYAAVFWFAGGPGVLFFAAQGLTAACLLEVVNYLEHYGLVRRRLADGTYERVQPHHSWNSAHLLTGLHLLNLPRHSDHHYKAGRAYQNLRHYDEAPQLPLGYAGMLVMAMVPPIWFRVMDPRVADWRERYGESAPS